MFSLKEGYLCGEDDVTCSGGDANLIGPLHMCQASNQRSDEGAVASNTKQAQTRIQTRKRSSMLLNTFQPHFNAGKHTPNKTQKSFNLDFYVVKVCQERDCSCSEGIISLTLLGLDSKIWWRP